MRTTLIIIVYFFTVLPVVGNGKTAIEHFYKARYHLYTIAAPINIPVGGKDRKKVFNVMPKSASEIRHFRYLSKEKWLNNSEKVLRSIIALCLINTRRNSAVGYLLDDRILFDGLVEMLNCTNEKFEAEAYKVLHTGAFYPWLEESKGKIISILKTSELDEIKKLKLLALSSRNNHRLRKHKNFNTLEIGLRARHGDKDAKNELFSDTAKTMDYSYHKRKLKQLFLAGTPKSLKDAINYYNKKIYYKENEARYYKSIRADVIAGFARFHPLDTIVFEELIRQKLQSSLKQGIKSIFQIRVPDNNGKYTSLSTEAYINLVVDWFKNNYNIIPEGSIGDPILFYWVYPKKLKWLDPEKLK